MEHFSPKPFPPPRWLIYGICVPGADADSVGAPYCETIEGHSNLCGSLLEKCMNIGYVSKTEGIVPEARALR